MFHAAESEPCTMKPSYCHGIPGIGPLDKIRMRRNTSRSMPPILRLRRSPSFNPLCCRPTYNISGAAAAPRPPGRAGYVTGLVLYATSKSSDLKSL